MKLKILVLTATICLLLVASYASALSIGIAPGRKEIILRENQNTTINYLISQSSGGDEIITMGTNADWIELVPSTFTLQSLKEQVVEARIKPLQLGTYTASIVASASAPGAIKVKMSMTASLDIVVVRAPEYEQNLKMQAQQFIVNAETMINTAKGMGADTSEAESILARARDALAKGNYEQAIDLADLANRMASEQQNKLIQKLRPIQLGLLILGIGATVVVSVIVYEVYRIYSKKKLAKSFKIVRGISCPACGKGMAETYTGTLVIGYVCPKCKHVVVSEKNV